MSSTFIPGDIWTDRSKYIEAENKLSQANKSAVKEGKGKRKGTAQNEKKIKSANSENKSEKIIEQENQTEENEPRLTAQKTRSKKSKSKSKSPMPEKVEQKSESENTNIKVETKANDEYKGTDEIEKKSLKNDAKLSKISEDSIETGNKTDIGSEIKVIEKSELEMTKVENSQSLKKSKKGKGQQQNQSEPKLQENKKLNKKEKPLDIKKESERDTKIEDKNINQTELKIQHNKENDNKMNANKKQNEDKVNELKSANESTSEMENIIENEIQSDGLKAHEAKSCENKVKKCNEKSSKLETKGCLAAEIMRVRKLIINSLEHEKKFDGSQMVDKGEDYDIKKRLMELSNDFVRLEKRVSLLEEFCKLQTEYMPSQKIDDD